MNPATLKDVEAIIKGTVGATKKLSNVTTVVCPPFVYTQYVLSKNGKGIVAIGAQNISTEQKGSYTGEVAAPMLAGLGVTHTIIGHSERRKMGETDEAVNKKVLVALASKITPIICIGETTRDDEGKYLSVIKDQIHQALNGVSKANLSKIVIAYEPVWAIGAATAMDAHDIHQMSIFIKKTLIELYVTKSVSVPLLYGGAVEPGNALGIMKDGEVDGLLVGRQGLDPKSFGEILAIANSI